MRRHLDAPKWAHNGSSGLLGVWVAMQEGYTHCVLAGVPLESRRVEHLHGVFDGAPASGYQAYRPAWKANVDILRPLVRSFGGWTREVFGPPTYSWLEAA
jgi:hypothetical protein